MKKHALITGGAGFIGTNLVKSLLKRDVKVTSIDNYSTGSKRNHILGATYLHKDILDIRDISEYGKFDVVYHLAANARIQPSFSLPIEYFENNTRTTAKIAKFCADNRVPLVHAGSSSHHSGKFKNPYTFSKDVSEEIVYLFQQHYNLQSSIARFYNVYGPHHLKDSEYSTLIGKWEHAIETNQPITIYGDGTKRRDFTHVSDVVNALVLIFEKNAWGHCFELGTGTNYSIQEIADFFQYKNTIYKKDRPGEAASTLCDSALAKSILDWNCQHNIKNYITDYVNNR